MWFAEQRRMANIYQKMTKRERIEKTRQENNKQAKIK